MPSPPSPLNIRYYLILLYDYDVKTPTVLYIIRVSYTYINIAGHNIYIYTAPVGGWEGASHPVGEVAFSGRGVVDAASSFLQRQLFPPPRAHHSLVSSVFSVRFRHSFALSLSLAHTARRYRS